MTNETLTQDNVRQRFKHYVDSEPVTCARVAKMIGLDEKQTQYVIQRFARGKALYPDTLKKLSDFMQIRAY